jgi:hypothetical protein
MSCFSNSWFNDDAHSGGIVGLLLAFVFITTGFCILLVRENGQPVPTWRKLTGIVILLLGFFSLITSSVFAAQD